MEPANQSPIKKGSTLEDKSVPPRIPDVKLAFLPDADELEKTPLSKGLSATIYILLAVIGFFVLWASIFEIDQIVTARGKLVTTQPNIVLQPMETAQISELKVRSGQIVSKGQVLAVLDPTFVQADLTRAQDTLKSLDAEKQRLERELQGQLHSQPIANSPDAFQTRLQNERLAAFKARNWQLNETINRYRASVQTNTHDIVNLEARVQSLKEIEKMNEQLTQQQFQSTMKLLESRERRQEVERELISARNRSVELNKQLAEAEAERASFLSEWRQKSAENLVNVERERLNAAEQLKKAEKRSSLIELIAPTDAVVLEVAARSAGSIVREAEPLITLVPLGETLEAEVQITAQDIGYIQLNDAVRVKIDAFPFQKHGLIKGSLSKLGQDAFSEDSASNTNTAPYYLGRVTLDKMNLRNLPRNAPLIPGMTLSSEILVGKRTIMSYILYPVMRGLDEAGREP